MAIIYVEDARNDTIYNYLDGAGNENSEIIKKANKYVALD